MSGQGPVHRFADYFSICGLDVNSGLEPDQLSGDNLHCPPLERPYKSKVLAHYPESVPWNPFDEEAIGMLSLPKGLNFRTQNYSREPKFHTFIITKEDGSRTFGAGYVFYEEVENEQICAAMQTLHAMHQAELSNTQSRTLYPHLGPGLDQSPQLKKKNLVYPEKSFDINRDKLYVTKCIALVTQLPFVDSLHHFLSQLFEAVAKQSPPLLPLESYVYNVLYEVPLPPPGRSIKFYGVSQPIFCQRPSVSELPLFDFCLWQLFQLLCLENVMQVFRSILLEHQVLFYSSDYQRLMLIAESFCTFVFPFTWQHVYVPILPASLSHFLDAPVPFIMGIHRGQEDRSELKIPCEANMCFVDIDGDYVEAPEELPLFPHQKELTEELSSVIEKYQSQINQHNSRNTSESPRKSSIFQKQSSESLLSSSRNWSSSDKLEILQQSEAWTKISALAKKTGVWSTIEHFSDSNKSGENEPKETTRVSDKALAELKFNNAIREVFLNRFVHMFFSYESFVISPTQDMEEWLSNREMMQNFDKAAFLSDQRETHLPFLSPFIETQMFTTLIDNKILSQWEDSDPYLRVFDARLKTFKERTGEARTPTYYTCDTIQDTETMLEKRILVDHVAVRPHATDIAFELNAHQPGVFHVLNKTVLNSEPVNQKPRTRDASKWRKKDRHLQHAEHIQLNPEQREKYIQEARSKSLRQPKLSDMSVTGMAQTNWRFVETLLKECRSKTKRMLVEKMGQEAVELGHGEVNITGVEENTLIASLCDLLERIWSHGLQTKKGKSALWSHMLSFQEIEECNDTSKPIDPNFLTPDISSMALEGEEKKTTTHRRTRSKGGTELPVLKSLPRSLNSDMKKVQQMTDIKTDVGFARAWVRLALEKKLLSTHLKELLCDTDLLRSLYKRYAFLRCEEEREQFLYHLLSLNAVDYFCFTNIFTNTMMPYKVLIYPSTKFGCFTTSANPWLSLAGQLGETGVIEIPKGCLEFNVEHRNLGILTTLRMGHDNSGMTPKWLVEYVLVRNEFAGHLYKFPCGKWLGKGIDDGSTERLLVAELVRPINETEDLVAASWTPPRCISPAPAASPKRVIDHGRSIPEVQEMLGHAVNNIVKHFHKPEKERGNLTYLLCGENGLVQCIELVFQCGFKSSRLFRNRFYIWDYLEKMKNCFEVILECETDDQPVPDIARDGYCLFCELMNKINNASQTIGKDGRFQIFVCIGIRDHLLQRWLPLMANTQITSHMYEENSFIRDGWATNFLVSILDTLNDYPISLEASLTRGLDI